jgi:chromate transporter
MIAKKIKAKNKVNNWYLLTTFLKVGSISFGGNMALLSIVQKVMVEKDKSFTSKMYFDAVSIGSLLPGPLAVNVVTFIGYALNKKRGALVSLVAILFPACLLMLLLSWVYFTFAKHYESTDVIHYVTGAVSAIVFSTAITMHRKEINSHVTKNLSCLAAFLVIAFTSNYFVTVGLILAGALPAFAKWGRPNVENASNQKQNLSLDLKYSYLVLVAILILIECLFFLNVQALFENIYVKIVMVFSGISLSLFGGGYVAVPVMQSMFVNDLAWLSPQEFVDAIAFSQITPGPILVSATFIGYKLGGITGAVLATISMFAPSAALIILVSKIHKLNKDNVIMRYALDGVKVIIIGMIAASTFRILAQTNYNIKAIAVFIIMLITIQVFKVSPFLTILLAALFGFIIEVII